MRQRILRFAAWAAGLSLIALLGLVRTGTEAEFAFASAAILPVMLIAWFGSLRQGQAAACLAAAMWLAADLHSGRDFSAAWVPVLNGATRLITYVLVAYLVARVKSLLARETERATLDALTGLLNRRAFLEVGEAEAHRAHRYGRPLAVGFVDLDDFKQINDTRGHEAGDRALQDVAAALRSTLRASDVVARLGGDEFALVFPETGHDVAGDVGRKIRVALERALVPYPPVSASIGLACFEVPLGEFAPMLKQADALMYEIKQAGKGALRIQAYPSGDTAQPPGDSGSFPKKSA